MIFFFTINTDYKKGYDIFTYIHNTYNKFIFINFPCKSVWDNIFNLFSIYMIFCSLKYCMKNSSNAIKIRKTLFWGRLITRFWNTSEKQMIPIVPQEEGRRRIFLVKIFEVNILIKRKLWKDNKPRLKYVCHLTKLL